MADEARSAVAYRTLIRPTASTSPGSALDMQNINTAPLPDGAACYVTSTRQLWRFRKNSTFAAVPNQILVPSAGGGRWVREVSTAGALPLFVTATSDHTTD